MRPIFHVLAAVGAGLALAGGCGGSTAESGTGSETNWLGACDADADCASGACVCGLCTTPCDEATPCADLQTCAARGSAPFALVCGQTSTVDSDGLCLARCGPERDCLNGSRCEEGVCLPREATVATGSALGEPCLPSDETRTNFGGFSAIEVHIIDRAEDCASRICTVHGFQGRVSCPYGQEDPTDPSCFSTSSGEPVSLPVPPQLVQRPAADAVICSCRCDGPAGTGPFCACPEGTECSLLIVDLGPRSQALAGSYCVKHGTWVDDPAVLEGTPTCDPALDNCPDR